MKKLHDDAILPQKATSGAAAFDLYACEDCNLGIRTTWYTPIRTGIAMEIPPGYFGKIYPRSGLCARNAVDVGAGVIDSDYRGEIKVLLINHKIEEVRISKGDRIAQIVIHPAPQFKLVESTVLSKTKRDQGRFGSTGK